MKPQGPVPTYGVTGGIGSGKSLVCRIFSCLGIPVFYSDQVARQLMEQDAGMRQEIIHLLGAQAYQGTQYQAAWVWSRLAQAPELIQALNAIVHPRVRAAGAAFAQAPCQAPFRLYESALLDPKHHPSYLKDLILVDCPQSERMEHLQTYKKLSKAEVLKRMDTQAHLNHQAHAYALVLENRSNKALLPQILNLFCKLSMVLLFLFMGTSAWAQESLNVMTFNIRMDTPNDGPNQWKFRKEHCAALIQYQAADFIGMQEAFIHQIKDLQGLMPQYRWFGLGRDDGKEAGEFSPLFYQANKFKLLKQATFWLSDSCDKVSFGWDAACRRVVTWGHFKSLKTGKDFFVFNTHFDHMGKVARRESAHLVLRKIQEIAGKKPVILLGDFNATPEDEPIQILRQAQGALALTDSETISKAGHYGPYSTFNAFKEEQTGKHIDYIFVKNGWECLRHATHSESWAGKFPSDHFPVSAQLRLP